MLKDKQRGEADNAIFRRPVRRLEAFLVYNGAPNPEDDPADYYRYPKGVRIA